MNLRRAPKGRFVSATAVMALVLAGAPTASAQVVQNCQPQQYLDRTAPAADRQLTWDFSIETDPERCIRIRAGQSVLWTDTDFDSHPLGGSGGDSPNPIGSHQNGLVTFSLPGTYGYECLSHSSMTGAIQVIAAAPAVPALAFWQLAWLASLLLVAGSLVLGRLRARAARSA